MAVPTRIVSQLTRCGGAIATGGGTPYIVETINGAKYMFYIDANTVDPSYATSLDGGITWSAPISLKSINCTQIAVWYDRWSGLNTDLIHIVYTDLGVDDVYYRNIDTANSDALSTETVVFAGASTANGGAISIARMRGGNLIVVGSIDLGTEIFSKKSTNTGSTWSDIAAGYESAGNADLCIVMPGWGADNQDAMMFYYDRSATEISVKYYDDSANSWNETSIATTISLPDHTSATLGHMAATVDLTNSQNLLVFWTAIDTANADLRCFKVTQSAQTEVTNVVLNSTDDQGFCCITICPINCWYVYYFGKSDGSETYATIINMYYKKSTDSGATWSSETLVENSFLESVVNMMFCIPKYYKTFSLAYNGSSNVAIRTISPLGIPRANYILGI